MRKPTNIEVNILAMNKLLPAFISFCKKTDSTVVGGMINRNIGCVEIKNKIYVIDSEGVGSELTNENKFTIDFFAEYKTDKDNTRRLSMFPKATTELDIYDIKKLMTNNTINLAVFIRSFGSRLDSNYELWRKKLES